MPSSWHGWNDEQYDKANQDAITSRPVEGPIKEAMDNGDYAVVWAPYKWNFIIGAIVNNSEVLFAPKELDPLSAGLWNNPAGVAQAPSITGRTPFKGSYAACAAHASRLNRLEEEKGKARSHIYSVDVIEKVAA